MMKDWRKRLAILGMLMALAACQTPQEEVVYTPAPLPEPEPEPQPDLLDEAVFQRQRMLADILYEAKKAVADNRLMQPAGNNATDMYQQVLRIDPGNKVALEGIQEVASRYIAMADAAISQTAFDNADGYLSRAASLSPELPELAVLRAKLAEARKTRLQSHPLNPAALSAKNLEMMNELAAIARQLQASGGTFLIRARSDDEGRWIYKVMREAVGGYRLRGNIDVGSPPAIVLLAAPKDAKAPAKPQRD